jgi:phosphohistidine phosphatase
MPEGEEQAARLARRLRKAEIKLDCILCSPAVRAFSTATILIEAGVGGKRCMLRTERRIYSSNADELFLMIEGVEKDMKAILVVGHNPSISELASLFTDHIQVLPPCALAAFRFDIKSWSKLRKADAKVVALRLPE